VPSGAEAIRFRWYATSEPAGKVFVERKTKADKAQGLEAIKVRTRYPGTLMTRFCVHSSCRSYGSQL
jgi:SPX domain protein involved in polyphosphate accumulation